MTKRVATKGKELLYLSHFKVADPKVQLHVCCSFGNPFPNSNLVVIIFREQGIQTTTTVLLFCTMSLL